MTAQRAFLYTLGLATLIIGGAVWLWRPSPLPVAQPIVVSRAFDTVKDTLRWGETISELFDRQGVAGLALDRFDVKDTYRPGQTNYSCV